VTLSYIIWTQYFRQSPISISIVLFFPSTSVFIHPLLPHTSASCNHPICIHIANKWRFALCNSLQSVVLLHLHQMSSSSWVCLLGWCVVQSSRCSQTFQTCLLPLLSRRLSHRRFRCACWPHYQGSYLTDVSDVLAASFIRAIISQTFQMCLLNPLPRQLSHRRFRRVCCLHYQGDYFTDVSDVFAASFIRAIISQTFQMC
jgi:hypothetical protein